MGPTAGPNSRQDIQESRAAIAHRWYLALLSAGCFQLERSETLQKFSHLTDQAMAFLLADDPEANAAQEIGAELASLPCVDPRAIEISAQLWAEHLFKSDVPAESSLQHLRTMILLSGMVAGFSKRAGEIVLEEQEEIRSAMAADLLRTTEELRRYQTHLEGMLAERTRELRESEEQFRVIAETSIDGIFQSIDENGTLIYLNNAFAKDAGVYARGIIGKNHLVVDG